MFERLVLLFPDRNNQMIQHGTKCLAVTRHSDSDGVDLGPQNRAIFSRLSACNRATHARSMAHQACGSRLRHSNRWPDLVSAVSHHVCMERHQVSASLIINCTNTAAASAIV